uniref:Uncharacterized protein n=1 Tax=Ditylenchus dipsaci TaxID=166011 RepID=A0A915DQI1_9BILA
MTRYCLLYSCFILCCMFMKLSTLFVKLTLMRKILLLLFIFCEFLIQVSAKPILQLFDSGGNSASLNNDARSDAIKWICLLIVLAGLCIFCVFAVAAVLKQTLFTQICLINHKIHKAATMLKLQHLCQCRPSHSRNQQYYSS